MSPQLSACKWLVFLGLASAFPWLSQGQSVFPRQGAEQPVAGALRGDQTMPHVALGASGGYIVWQDNITDPYGLGISARRINANFSGELSGFRVNKTSWEDQEHPQVSLLQDGGAAFVWQGGAPGHKNIFARFLRADGTFVDMDVQVNTYTNSSQINPQVCTLANGNVVVVWGSMDQDGSLQGVYGQRMTPLGVKLGDEFRVNVNTYLNQRTPALTALANGNFVVAWISEFLATTSQTVENRISVTSHVFARIYDGEGQPLGTEFRVNTDTVSPCGHPSISGMNDGSFTIVWGARDLITRYPPSENPNEVVPLFLNSWDIFGRTYHANGSPATQPAVINTHRVGDQYIPRISSAGTNQFVVWTSLNQDGFQEGVFGRFLAGGTPQATEVQVNTRFVSKQMQPAIASDGAGRFLVLWTSFFGGENSFDLVAQQFGTGSGGTPVQPGAPYVSALSQSSLSVTWPELAGYSGVQYELYVNGASTPVVLTQNSYVHGGLAPSTTHSFALAYRLPGDFTTPRSAAVSGRTWGADENFDGLPDDWQRLYWGDNPATWPPGHVDSDGDGVSNLDEFLNGTNPLDPESVLRTRIIPHRFGGILNWSTQRGFIYQVMISTDLKTWVPYGSPRFAAENSDSILVEGGSAAFYRIVRVRQ
jgi:hypothetical protein